MFYLNNDLDTQTRYDIIKFIEINKDNLDPLTSYFFYQLRNMPYVEELTIISEDKRPDLLSYNLYGTTQYWWILMLYNNILSVNDLVPGIKIKKPSLSTIEAFYVKASTLQKSKNNDSSV